VTKIKIFQNKYYKYLVIAGILWGFYPLIFDQSLIYLTILGLLAGRYIFGSLILYIRNQKNKVFHYIAINKTLVFYSVFASILPLSFFTVGISLTSPLHASIIGLSHPFFVYIFSVVFFKDQLHKKVVLGGVLATAGLAVIFASQSTGANGSSLFGDVLILSSQACSAIATNYARRLIHKKKVSSPDQLAFYDYFIASIFFGVLFIAQFAFTNINNNFSWPGLAWVVIAATLGGIIPYVFFLKSAKGLQAEKLADSNYIAPITGVLAAVLLTGASLGVADTIGLIIVFVGLAISNDKLQPIAHMHGVSSFMVIENKLIDKSLEFEKIFVESAKNKF
jgi:drug/metabolite transporter (DMT)-like permease